jgi:hypothetical protein
MFGRLWTEDRGQDIAEYALILAVTVAIIAGNCGARFQALAQTLVCLSFRAALIDSGMRA